MRYRSTRGALPVKLDQALVSGMASDGGLFLPEKLPIFTPADFENAHQVEDIARVFLEPFFEGSLLVEHLPEIIAETFSFPMPVTDLPVEAGSCGFLELFHGPTAAFKDVGAGFLAACLGRLEVERGDPLTILVATSGDTGGAVAAAFDERPGMRVAVLYPEGRVSARQAQQLTCWGQNVLSLAVDGTFDECQALVKGAMGNEILKTRHRFSSANSINIGRLLPQAIYYVKASLTHWRQTGRKLSFIVPTGNLGNAFGCYVAREMGLPISKLVLATNSNRIIVDYLDGVVWAPRSSIATLASAMDVGNPSNMERLRSYGGDASTLAKRIQAVSVSDPEIEEEIRKNFLEFGFATCPHTATASFAWRALSNDDKLSEDWIMVATAHAAKFDQIVEPIIGQEISVPIALQKILARESEFKTIQPTLDSLTTALDGGF